MSKKRKPTKKSLKKQQSSKPTKLQKNKATKKKKSTVTKSQSSKKKIFVSLESCNIKTCLRWLDNNVLLILVGFLLAFIPLYPKLPLAEIIPGYIVRIRLEDIFIAVAVFIWGIQILRKKARWNKIILWIVLLYALAGFLSLLSGMFITKMIPLEMIHIGKSALHWFRYLEYFSLLFVGYSAIKQKNDLWKLLVVFGITVVAVSIYGYGQRYWYWPVYSTMNREFSKGMRLYLTPHARVQSTFGGHYDMAAFLVIALPIMLSLWFASAKRWIKIGVGITFLLGLWLLIVSASRASFIAFSCSAFLVIGIFAFMKEKWISKIWFATSRVFILYALVGVMFVSFGDDMYERFLILIEGYPQIHSTYHAVNGKRKEATTYALAFIGLREWPEPEPPTDGMSTDDLAVMVASDQRPTSERPTDVYTDVPEKVKIATTSADGTEEIIEVERDRTWSECALKHSLSICIRIETLWPRAVRGFTRNPLMGSGYATLTKENVIEFTEAESTDNNFLRTLGETGLFGFLTFYGVIVFALYSAVRFAFSREHPRRKGLAIGFIAASVGLLLNALYIDVFAASKVAFIYWAITGMLLSYIELFKQPQNNTHR